MARTPTQLLLFSDDGASPNDAPSIAGRLIDPQATFDAWLMSQTPPYRQRTKQVYKAIWTKFVSHLADRRLPFNAIKPEDIKLFLQAQAGVKRNQREQYQRLMERAFEGIMTAIDPGAATMQANPAALINVFVPKGEAWRDAPANDPKQFLSRTARAQLVEKLQAVAQDQVRMAAKTESGWRALRDTTLVAFILATGAKVAELTVLSINSVNCNERTVDFSAYFGFASDGGGALVDPHQDAVHAFRGDDEGSRRILAINDWLLPLMRTWQGAGHASGADPALTRLFPALSERPGAVLHPSSVHRLVAKWGEGHLGLALTPQRLRNTCGASWLDEGVSLDELERRMGYSTGAAAGFRLNQAWNDWLISHVDA